MTIADSILQRQAWMSRAGRAKLELDDLRMEIDIAMRTRAPFPTIRTLARADIHLERAMHELAEAIAEIGGLK